MYNHGSRTVCASQDPALDTPYLGRVLFIGGTIMELDPGEEYLKKNVTANLFRGIEAVGGWLSITTERVLFRSHKVNFQKQPLQIKLKDIAKIEKRHTLGLIPNGLRILLKNGKEFKFVVWNREQLIDMMDSARKHQQEN
jgi:hypothetical protein